MFSGLPPKADLPPDLRTTPAASSTPAIGRLLAAWAGLDWRDIVRSACKMVIGWSALCEWR